MRSLKHIFLGYLFVVAVGFQQSQAQENPEVSKLETYYYNKCLKNTGSAVAFTKLRSDTYEMYKYFEYAFGFLPAQREAFCKEQRSNLVYRVKEIANDLKPCLVEGEKYLADFIKESFTEFLHFFCHNNGEYTKTFFGNEGSQCRKKIQETKTNDLEDCMNRIFAPRQSFITKKEMCDDVTVARKCFSQLLEVNCQSSFGFKRLNDVFFDYVGKPCSSCIHAISSFVLIGSLLVHFVLNKI